MYRYQTTGFPWSVSKAENWTCGETLGATALVGIPHPLSTIFEDIKEELGRMGKLGVKMLE
ncbi:MAG: hypothetical protein QMD80_00510 [archaeon]|nr:hypothetical protein [archaeon]